MLVLPGCKFATWTNILSIYMLCGAGLAAADGGGGGQTSPCSTAPCPSHLWLALASTSTHGTLQTHAAVSRGWQRGETPHQRRLLRVLVLPGLALAVPGVRPGAGRVPQPRRSKLREVLLSTRAGGPSTHDNLTKGINNKRNTIFRKEGFIGRCSSLARKL